MAKDDNHRELRQYFEGIEMKRLEVKTIKTPLFRPSFAAMMTEILTFHGVIVEAKKEYCLITFPEGTYKIEALPRTQAERYTITLPDGFELHESKMRADPYSYLQLDVNGLSPQQQEALSDTNK